MAVYFVESSALAKRYIAETGSMWLRSLLDPSTGCSIYVVRVTAVEIIAALTRRERGRTLAPTDAAAARQAFRHDLATTYQVIEVTPALANRAMLLAEQYGLRGYDAIQLGNRSSWLPMHRAYDCCLEVALCDYDPNFPPAG